MKASTPLLIGLFALAFWACTPEPAEVTTPSNPSTSPPALSASPKGSAASDQHATANPALLSKLKRAVVFVRTPVGSGSGFLVADAGGTPVVITNAHVVEPNLLFGNPKELQVVLDSGTGRETVLKAVKQTVDHHWDLAVLTVAEPEQLTSRCLTLSPQRFYMETMSAMSIGYPFGEGLGGGGFPSPTFTKGTVSSVRRDRLGQVVAIQLDVDLNPGNSGGPVLAEDGTVLGVAVATISGTDISFMIPVEAAYAILFGGILNVQCAVDANPSQDHAAVTVDVEVHDPQNLISRVSLTVNHTYTPTDADFSPPYHAMDGQVISQNLEGQSPISFGFNVSTDNLTKTWFQLAFSRRGDSATTLTPPLQVPATPTDASGAAHRSSAAPAPGRDPLPDGLQPSMDADMKWCRTMRKRKETVNLLLPSRIGPWELASGGRRMVAQVGALPGLFVLDWIAGGIEGTLNLDRRDFLFAAGGDTLVIYLPAVDVFQIYRLSDLKLRHTRPNPLPSAAILFLKMGMSNDRRLIISWKESSNNFSQGKLSLMDVETFEHVNCNIQQGAHSRRWDVECRFSSANHTGTLFGSDYPGSYQGEMYCFVGSNVQIINCRHARSPVFVTHQGDFFSANGYVKTFAGDESEIAKGARLFPSIEGKFCLILQAEDQREDFHATLFDTKTRNKVRRLAFMVPRKAGSHYSEYSRQSILFSEEAETYVFFNALNDGIIIQPVATP